MENCPKFHAGHTKNGRNRKTEQILFTLENMHQVDSSLLFSPRCDVTATIVTCLFISSQTLCVCSSSSIHKSSYSGPSALVGATTNAWEPSTYCVMPLQTLCALLTQASGDKVRRSLLDHNRKVHRSRGQDKEKKGECLSLLKPRFAEHLIRHSDQEHRPYKPTLLGFNLCWTA